MPLKVLKNGAIGEYIEGKYKDNEKNRKLGRVGETYKKFIIRQGAEILPKKKRRGKGVEELIPNLQVAADAIEANIPLVKQISRYFVDEDMRKVLDDYERPEAVARRQYERDVKKGLIKLDNIKNFRDQMDNAPIVDLEAEAEENRRKYGGALKTNKQKIKYLLNFMKK